MPTIRIRSRSDPGWEFLLEPATVAKFCKVASDGDVTLLLRAHPRPAALSLVRSTLAEMEKDPDAVNWAAFVAEASSLGSDAVAELLNFTSAARLEDMEHALMVWLGTRIDAQIRSTSDRHY